MQLFYEIFHWIYLFILIKEKAFAATLCQKKEQPKQVSRFNCTLKYGQKNRKMSKTIEICRD